MKQHRSLCSRSLPTDFPLVFFFSGVKNVFGLAVFFFALNCGGGQTEEAGAPPATPVLLAQAQVGGIEEAAELVGTVQARESVQVKSLVEGPIEFIGFREGELVKKGSILFRINETKLRAALNETGADLQLAKKEKKRVKGLVKEGVLSDQDLDRASSGVKALEARKTADRQDLSEAVIRAPFDCTIGERFVDQGQNVSRGERLADLVGGAGLEVAFEVPERHSAKLALGLPLQVRVAGAEEPLSTEVNYIDPAADPVSRTLLLKAELLNAPKSLRPGQFAKVHLVLTQKPEAVSVPEAAILIQGGTSMVVVSAEGVAQFRPVQTGIRQQGRVEILDGLVAGEQVVVEGHQKVFPGAQLRDVGQPEQKENL